MGSIKPVPFCGIFFLSLLTVSAVFPLSAQSPGSLNLVTEIQGIERILAGPGTGAAERRGALIRLARLYRLAGNSEGAARAWADAAAAEPGKQEDAILLEGALGWIALGEYDKARTNVNMVLGGNGDRELIFRARYVAAQIDAFSTGDIRNMARLLEENDYREYRPALLYTLWRVSGDAAYRTKLLADHPSSPEGLMAGENSGRISLVPSAMWILFPGRESITLGPPLLPSPAVPSGPSLLPPVTRELPAASRGGQTVLQTGLFSREENARNLIRRLQNAGFTGTVSPRRVNGADYWAVTVPAGPDVQQTIMRLKDAGFESFPVF